MFVSTFIENVVEFLKSYKRQPRRFGPKGFDPFRTEIQSLEPRLVLAAPMLGAELATYELNTVFGSVNGRWGESREIDGVLYTPGNANRSPVVSKLNLQTGQTTTLVLEGEGSVSGIFKKEGQIFFVGFSIGDDGGYDVTYWNNLGNATVISSLSDSNANFVSYDGRMVLQIGNHTAGYADVGNNILHTLPGFLNFKLNPTSITPNNRFIGVGGFDQDSTIGLIYELNPTSGEYVLLNVNYRATRGEDMSLMYLFDSPHGVLSASLYLNLETYQDETAIFSLDGTVRAELEGIPRAAVAVGDKVFVATQGVEGRITAFNKTWGKEEYTSAQIFGVPGIEFQAGSLAATADGKLVVIGTRVSDGKVFVKTFEVPQDVTLSQVDVNSITIPSLEVGQVDGREITWAPVAGATGYDITLIRNGVVAQAVSVTGTSYTVSASIAAGDYKLSIRATKGDVKGPWSSDASVVVKPQRVLASSITGLPVEAISTDFTVRWIAATGATRYDVQVVSTTSTGRVAPIFSASPTSVSTILSGIGAGKWEFQLRPVTEGDTPERDILGDWTTVNFTVKHRPVVAATIGGLLANPGNVNLTWAGVLGATLYNVEVWKVGSNTPLFTRQVTTNTTSFVITTTGEYEVRIEVLGNPASTNSTETVKSFTVLLPRVNAATLAISQAIAGVATTLRFDAVSGAASYDIKVFNVRTGRYVVDVNTSSTSYNVLTGLIDGTYRLEVRAKDSVGVSEWSTMTTTIVPLGKVSGVNVVGLASGQASGTFSWSPISGATRYLLVIRDGNTIVRQVFVSGTAFSLATGLPPGKYQVQVTAGNALVYGAPSTVKSVLVRVSTVTNLWAPTIQVGDAPRFAWRAVPGATGYDIWTGRYRLTSTGTVFTGPANLSAGTHRIWVRATNADGPGAWSSVDLTVTPLAKVEGVRFTGLSHSQVTGGVSWGAIRGATEYELSVYANRNGTWVRVMNVTVRGTSFTLSSGLAAGRYQIYVKAEKGTFTGPVSTGKAVTVKLAPVTGIFTPLTMVGKSDRVTWTRVAGATEYEVQIRIAGTTTIVHRGTTTGAFYVLPSNLPAGRYDFLVRGKNADPAVSQPTFSTEALTVADLPAVVKDFVDGIKAIAGNQPITLIIRDAKLKTLGIYYGSTLPLAALKLVSLPNGTYPIILKVGSVSQVVRFTKPLPAPRVLVALPADGKPLVTWSPTANGKVVNNAQITFVSKTGKVADMKMIKGSLGKYKSATPLLKGDYTAYVRLYLADGTPTLWFSVTVTIK